MSATGQRTVLHFVSHLGAGGAEAMLCNLVRQMQPEGWRSVVVMMHPGAPVCQSAALRPHLAGFHNLDSRSYFRPSMWRALHGIMRLERPDVVQTWMHRPDLIGGLIARVAGIRRIVWGIHSRDIYRSAGESDTRISLWRKVLQQAAKWLPQRIVSCSATALNDHATMGYPRARMTWIANGICPQRFKPDAAARAAMRKELGLPDDVPVVGFVGRFHEVKDLPTLLRAAAIAQQQRPDLHLVLWGGTEAELDRPLPPQVRCLPFRTDVENLYPAMDVFSLASLSEALPMTLIEAMSCGTLCAATDVGDCAAVLRDIGKVVPVGDAAALAAAWLHLIGLSKEERATLAAAGRERVLTEFSIAAAARSYASTYEALMEGPQ